MKAKEKLQNKWPKVAKNGGGSDMKKILQSRMWQVRTVTLVLLTRSSGVLLFLPLFTSGDYNNGLQAITSLYNGNIFSNA